MKRIIRHLRRQPERVRIQILFIITASSALVLFILWARSFGIDTTSPGVNIDITKDLTPFTVLKENIVEGAKGLKFPQ